MPLVMKSGVHHWRLPGHGKLDLGLNFFLEKGSNGGNRLFAVL
jgi:hypothetical protein